MAVAASPETCSDPRNMEVEAIRESEALTIEGLIARSEAGESPRICPDAPGSTASGGAGNPTPPRIAPSTSDTSRTDSSTKSPIAGQRNGKTASGSGKSAHLSSKSPDPEIPRPSSASSLNKSAPNFPFDPDPDSQTNDKEIGVDKSAHSSSKRLSHTTKTGSREGRSSVSAKSALPKHTSGASPWPPIRWAIEIRPKALSYRANLLPAPQVKGLHGHVRAVPRRRALLVS